MQLQDKTATYKHLIDTYFTDHKYKTCYISTVA